MALEPNQPQPEPTAIPAGQVAPRKLPVNESSLRSGAIRSRPAQGKSQQHPGVFPLSPLTHRTQRFQPLPPPLGEPPYHIDLSTLVHGIDELVAKNGQLVFHTVGDTGGIKNPDYQRAVAKEMKTDLNEADIKRPRFFYHLGDVVYYNGEIDRYYDQFYEPYDHYDAPIIAVPGNHDGDPINNQQTSLDGWVRYFMTPMPVVNPDSHDAPRVTLSLPNVYFTLNCPLLTIIGMYSNVPENGSIDSIQQQWLTHEFATAPKDKALIVAVHHPVYSFDDHHSGSPHMADALQHAINDSRRVPNMVLNAHVHNYQRIERPIINKGITPFIVAGHGGYAHLHGINVHDGLVDPDTQAHLVKSNHDTHGYVTLTVSKDQIQGNVTLIKTDGTRQDNFDTFAYSAAAQFLAKGVMISL